MTGQTFPFALTQNEPPRIGLIALQSDETIESDFRRLVPADVEFLVSRVPSASHVSQETLAAMEGHLTGAAALFPETLAFDAIGYGCTSGTAQIGAERVTARIRDGATTAHVTNPVTALIAACHHLGLTRIAFLSPYVATVSDHLRATLAEAGVATPVFGSFDVAEEAKVARIAPGSIKDAAEALTAATDAEALFLSCTNLRTLDIIAPLEDTLGRPVLSSNQVLAWHLLDRIRRTAKEAPGRLFQPSSSGQKISRGV